MTTITLDTPLAKIGFDNAGSIGEELVSTAIAGDEWGLAWHRVLRAGGTVGDLRAYLYDDLWEIDSGQAWDRYVGEQTTTEWCEAGGATTAEEIARYLSDGPLPIRDSTARDHLARLLAEHIAA